MPSMSSFFEQQNKTILLLGTIVLQMEYDGDFPEFYGVSQSSVYGLLLFIAECSNLITNYKVLFWGQYCLNVSINTWAN